MGLSSRQNEHQKCVDDCDAAIALSPQYLKARLRRAAGLEALDKLDEALEGVPNHASRSGNLYC